MSSERNHQDEQLFRIDADGGGTVASVSRFVRFKLQKI